MSQPLRVLVIGDPYMPVSAYAESLAGLDGAVMVTAMQIEDIGSAPPRTESERSLREYAGDPAEVARAAAGQEVLIVHGAPVSSEALDAGPLRLVCCARGGPVNVDVAAATDRGIPVVNTPGKNAEAVAELTIAFALLLPRAVPRASRYLLRRGGPGRARTAAGRVAAPAAGRAQHLRDAAHRRRHIGDPGPRCAARRGRRRQPAGRPGARQRGEPPGPARREGDHMNGPYLLA